MRTVVTAATSGIVAVIVGAGLAVAATSTPGGMAALKNFHAYPTGKWRQEATGTLNGQPVTPSSTTSCASPLTAGRRTMIAQLGQSVAPDCTTTVITDQPRQAVIMQSCAIGPRRTSNRTTLTAVNDRELTADVETDTGGGIIKGFIKSTYLGACAPGEAAASSKIPPKECAEMLASRGEMDGMEAQCAQLPAGYQAQCRARVAAGQQAFKALASQCGGQ